MINSIVVGLVTGIVSGLIVNYYSKKREEKQATFDFWFNFLFEQLKFYEIHIDADTLSRIPSFKDGRTTLRDAIFNIYDEVYPQNREDKTFSGEENVLFENITIALKELNEWKKENKKWF